MPGAVAKYLLIDPGTLTPWQRLTQWVIFPESRPYALWTYLVLVTVYITALIEPYAAAFSHSDPALLVFGYIFDIIYWIDFVVLFHVPYIEEHVYIMDVGRIARNHLTPEFLVNILAVFPFEVFAPLVPLDWMFAVSLLRLNRLLRIYRIYDFLTLKESELNAPLYLIGLKFSFLISTSCHMFACFIFIIACPHYCTDPAEYQHAWPLTVNYTPMFTLSMGSKYLLSLYLSVYTATTTGYGHIHPVNDVERAVTMITIVLCNFIFSYMVGSLTSYLVNIRGIQLQYEQKVQAVRDFMMQRSFSEELQCRVMDYYEYIWLRTNGIDAYRLLERLPRAVYSEVALTMNEVAILKVPLFQGSSRSFLMALSRSLKLEVFLPGDIIVHKGDVGQEMVFDAMGEGSFFGEVSLLKMCPRTANIRAATHCDVRVLTKKDLDMILVEFPDMKGRIHSKADERLRKQAERKASVSAFGGHGGKGFVGHAAPPPVIIATTSEGEFDAAGFKSSGGIPTVQPIVRSDPDISD